MTGKDHANLLGIFAYVFAGIQSLITFFFGAYLVIIGGLTLVAAIGGNSNDLEGVLMMFVISAVFGIFFALGLASIVMNIRMGRRLRNGRPLSQRSVMVTSIVNCCAVLFGGMFSMPFGAAVGAYGIWFATSDVGKRFFQGVPDPSPAFFNPSTAKSQARTYNEPYRWR